MDVVGAIADPVRRQILTMLSRGARTAGAVAAEFDISRPAVSRHLRILREHGLVQGELRGRERVYRLDVTPLVPVDTWLTGLLRPAWRWEANLDALETEVHRTRRDRRQGDAADRPTTARPPETPAGERATRGKTA